MTSDPIPRARTEACAATATATGRCEPCAVLRAERIAPQTGTSFELRKGQVLRVVDPQGEQVADLFAFEAGNTDRWLSSGRSIDYAGKTNLSTGDVLYSNDSRPMFTIIGDSVGKHDFLLTPCSQEMFEILYGCTEHHPSCFENLALHLARFGVRPSQIHTTFNIFMNVCVNPAGELKVGVPASRAGDWIDLVAEMDLWCGLTACSAEGSNNGRFKPIDYTIGACAMAVRSLVSPTLAVAPGQPGNAPCNGKASVVKSAEGIGRPAVRRFSVGDGPVSWL